MSKQRIVPTKSLLKRIGESSSDDIPTTIIREHGDFYHFPVKLGNGDWAMLIVPERTINNKPEYFKGIRV